jgi:membrane-associated protease RseP (regulator of RpoE activity)
MRRRPWLNLVLFAATCVTTLFAGAFWSGGFAEEDPLRLLWSGAPFAATLMGILGTHEMGHYVYARWHRVDTSLPYFIPFLPPFGTMGAVIRMRSQIPSRRALLDIGAAGPLAGLVVAVPLLIYGLTLSEIRPSDFQPGALNVERSPFNLLLYYALNGEWAPEGGPSAWVEGNSLLYLMLKTIVFGPIPKGHDVFIHPIALAGWFGLFVTSMNLIPIGQLDGGHIAYALLGRRADAFGRWTNRLLFIIGFFSWQGWLVWGVLTRFIGIRHPPVEEEEPLTPGRRLVAAVSLACFFLTFTPAPLQLL